MCPTVACIIIMVVVAISWFGMGFLGQVPDDEHQKTDQGADAQDKGDLLELRNAHGRPAPRRILAGVSRGQSFRDAFRDATGTSLPTAVSSFWQRHSFWYRWVPILGSSFTLWLLIVALAFVAWWRKKRRVAALRRAWDEEEAAAAQTLREPPDLIH